jgi:hypothetical protein
MDRAFGCGRSGRIRCGECVNLLSKSTGSEISSDPTDQRERIHRLIARADRVFSASTSGYRRYS